MIVGVVVVDVVVVVVVVVVAVATVVGGGDGAPAGSLPAQAAPRRQSPTPVTINARTGVEYRRKPPGILRLMQDGPGDLGSTAALLNEVFGFDPPLLPDHLAWHYLDNPVGVASVGRVVDGDRRLGNYALIPQVYTRGAERLRLGLGVDLAVSPSARGQGTFRTTVEDAYRRGAAEGLHGILGVANANSAPRMVAALGWRAYEALPARIVVPARSRRGLTHRPVDAALLDSDDLRDITAGGFVEPDGGRFAQRWDRELLRWRLAKPGVRYWLHHDDEVVIVSTRTTIARVRFAVLAKILLRRRPAAPVSAGPLAAAVQRFHRAPLAVHWGRNRWVNVRGPRIPEARMPSPLQIVLHSFHPDFAVDDFELDTFEFLDFDAY